jgi:hypothetical protein
MSPSRRGFALSALVLLLLCAGASPSCYRAEIDLGLLAASPPDPSGNTGGEAGASGAAEPACDETQVDDEQAQCRMQLPTRAECAEPDPDGWSACYDGGCNVCVETVTDYPYYFKWHPCCQANSTCNSNGPGFKCNARCPPPTEHDKVPPCWLAEATP